MEILITDVRSYCRGCKETSHCDAVSERGGLGRRVRIVRVRRLEQIAQGGIAILADGNIEWIRRGVLHQRQRLLDVRLCDARACSNLVGPWLAPVLLKFAPRAMNLPCGFRHVLGDANHAGPGGLWRV